jgi:hypothetical protein
LRDQSSGEVIPLSEGRIDADVLCLSCGYNLRGLLLHGRCTECNAEIATSTRSDLLRFADPAWVHRLRRGLLLQHAGVDVFSFAVFLSAFVGIYLRAPSWLWPTFLAFGCICAPALYILGSMSLTTPEPAPVTYRGGGWLQTGARWGWIPVPVCIAIAKYQFPEWATLPCLAAIPPVSAAWLGLLFAHVAGLVRRIPARRVQGVVDQCVTAFVVCGVVTVCGPVWAATVPGLLISEGIGIVVVLGVLFLAIPFIIANLAIHTAGLRALGRAANEADRFRRSVAERI